MRIFRPVTGSAADTRCVLHGNCCLGSLCFSIVVTTVDDHHDGGDDVIT